MLKKRLGINAVERNWDVWESEHMTDWFKIPSTLIIPDGCWKVGRSILYCCHSLKKVVIPGSVKMIDDYAFYGCEKLREVIISESCEEIGERAFEFCESLKKVVIPGSVKMIRNSAFSNCDKLEEVVIPESVEIICNYAFYGCINATIILRKPMSEFKEIRDQAFLKCKYVKEETRT